MERNIVLFCSCRVWEANICIKVVPKYVFSLLNIEIKKIKACTMHKQGLNCCTQLCHVIGQTFAESAEICSSNGGSAVCIKGFLF